MNPVLPNFLVELIQRLSSKSPKFFQAIQIISGVVAIIAFLPELLVYLSVSVPEWAFTLNSLAMKVGALTALIVARLPNQTK